MRIVKHSKFERATYMNISDHELNRLAFDLADSMTLDSDFLSYFTDADRDMIIWFIVRRTIARLVVTGVVSMLEIDRRRFLKESQDE